jgi:hypothetical protein
MFQFKFIIMVSIIWWDRDSSFGKRMATDWKIRGLDPGGGEIFRTRPDRPWGPSNLLHNGYRVLPGVKLRPSVLLTTHPLVALRSRMCRAILLLPLLAFGACCRANFTYRLIITNILFHLIKGFIKYLKLCHCHRENSSARYISRNVTGRNGREIWQVARSIAVTEY